MDPIIIVLAQNTAAAAFAIMSRKLAPRLPHAFFQVNAIVIGLMYGAGLLWAGMHPALVHSADLWHWLPWLVGGGVAFAVTNALSFKVFQYVDAALASLLSTFNILAAIVISTLVLTEDLNLRSGAGAVLVIGASWLVLSAHVGKLERRAWTIGLGLSLLAAIFYGVATVNEKYLLNHMELPSYLLWGWGVQVVVAFGCSFLAAPKRGYGEILKEKPWALLGTAGALRAASGFFFVLALVTLNNLSVVSAVSGLKVVIAALFGWVFLHEGQFAIRKIAASFVAALGIAIMFW